jgi:mono/diheme cytochrome c family protein
MGQADNLAIDPDHAAKRTKGLEIFKSQIRDLVKQKCVHCHSGEATEGKLDLGTQQGLLKGGDHGPAVVIGRGDKSLLTRLISHQQEPHMPKDGEPLSATQIAAIVTWIDLGAPYDEPLVESKVESWVDRKIAPRFQESLGLSATAVNCCA